MENSILEQHEANKLIALFMGFKEDDIQAEEWCGCNVRTECKVTGDIDMIPANYDSNWQWLMPVVEKIETLYESSLIFFIKANRAYIEKDTQKLSMCFNVPDGPLCYSGFCDTKIVATYRTCVQFIQWYNSANPPQ